MKRRSFLKASVAMPAALEGLASGQSADRPAHGDAHVVGEGQDRFGERHELGFSTLLFRVATRDSGGSLFAIEHRGRSKGGPPEHIHLYQDEWFYVLEGEVLFQIGGKKMLVKPGESVLGPRRVPHCFTGVKEPVRMLIAFTPAGKMEEFFRVGTGPNPPKDEAAFYAAHGMRIVGPGLAG